MWGILCPTPPPASVILPVIPSPTPTIISPPTIDSILGSDHSWSASLDPEQTVTLLSTGDILTARSVNISAVNSGDFGYPFRALKNLLASADITYINLESPLLPACPVLPQGTIFCGRPEFAKSLSESGIDIANLANNHSTNFGPDGLATTMDLLNRNKILTTGVSGPVYTQRRGGAYAFLGFNDIGGPYTGIAAADAGSVTAQILLARKNARQVIVQFHWGNEYTHKVTDRQRELAHLSIDSGADLVLGNHPHWIQPLEIYKDKLIVYSHGNFVFDQNWSQTTRQGVVGEYKFFNRQLVDARFIPVYISTAGQPQIATGSMIPTILSRLR